MDQNQLDNSDLQKAIDDITKTTSVDPVFSDPVAAPSSVPEGDNGALGEPVGPFPEPKMELPTPPAPTEPLAPLDASMGMPDMSLPPMPEPAMPAPAMPAAPEMAPAPTAPTPEIAPAEPNLNMQQVKEAALRDLAPILDHMNVNPSQKFRIYRDMFTSLRDYTVLEAAYRAAKDITDETERGDALLFLIDAIDNM